MLFAVGLTWGEGVSFALESKASFTDVPRTNPYYLSIHYWSGLGVVNGYEDNSFRSDNPINRAEVLKVILKGAGKAVSQEANSIPFSDVRSEDWFAPYVMTAYGLHIVSGNDADSSFTPARQVNKAEFLKMLFLANNVNVESFADQESPFKDVPEDAWFTPYLNYAATLGIIEGGESDFIYPSKSLTRGEVAEIMYLFALIGKGTDTQFLLDRTEDQLTQIEIYIAANRVDLAKKCSQLAVDLSQQALKNMSWNNIVLGAAKLARAYDYLVDAYQFGVSRNYAEAIRLANDAIGKATEAWQVNNATQPIAKHIKDRAREILMQVGGEEVEQ